MLGWQCKGWHRKRKRDTYTHTERHRDRGLDCQKKINEFGRWPKCLEIIYLLINQSIFYFQGRNTIYKWQAVTKQMYNHNGVSAW